MKIKLKIFFLFIFFLTLPLGVHAKKTVQDAGAALNVVAGKANITEESPSVIIGTVTQWALGIIGVVFILLMFYAGFRWITSRGEEDSITKARRTMIAAAIGLVIIIGAYAITSFVVSRLTVGNLDCSNEQNLTAAQKAVCQQIKNSP